MSRSPRELRSYAASSDAGAHDEADEGRRQRKSRACRCEWSNGRAPDLWFCYHPYYKAPDLIGPALSRQFGLAYVTAEASYSARRNIGAWADSQALVADAVRQAAVNICFTAEGPRRAADHRAGRPLRDARRRSSMRRLSRHQAVAGFAPHRHGRHDAAGRQARKLSHAGPSAGADRRSAHGPSPSPATARAGRRCMALFARLAPAPPGMAGRTASGRDAVDLRQRRDSMSGPAAAKPMALPISKPRQPDCRSSRRISPACPTSSATARPAC